jgi:hypothetical protein
VAATESGKNHDLRGYSWDFIMIQSGSTSENSDLVGFYIVILMGYYIRGLVG